MTTAGAVMNLPNRLKSLAAVILMILFTEIFFAGGASHAADDCLSKPNTAAPQGSHWYYRLDRTTHRECWYLGPGGRKGPPQQSRSSQAWQAPPSKKTTQPAPQNPLKVTPPEAVTTQATP